MKYLNLFESFNDDQRKIYVIRVESLGGPDYNFTELVVFPASNDEEAKRSFVNALSDGAGTNYLSNKEVYSADLSNPDYDGFVMEVLDDEYYTSEGWSLIGELVGKYDSLPSVPSNFKYDLLYVNNEEWSNSKKQTEIKESLKKLTSLIGVSNAQSVMKAVSDIENEEQFFSGVADIMKHAKEKEKSEIDRLSKLSVSDLQKEIDQALDAKDFSRVKMLAVYLPDSK